MVGVIWVGGLMYMLSVCIHNEASSSLLDAISNCNLWTSFDFLSCSMLYHLRPLMREAEGDDHF